MSLFRPTALKYIRNLGGAALLCLGLLALWSGTAIAAPAKPAKPAKPVAPAPHVAPAPPVKPAPPAVNAELAVCPGQTFSQPFEAFGDSNYYTLVEGSEFNGGPEGWELENGATVAGGTRPDGSSGGVLSLPPGATAVSPPVCVTLQYPTARAWIQTVQGGGGVTVGVYYAGAKPTGQVVGQLSSKTKGAWELSNAFNVKPELAGNQEGVREVRFVYANTTKDGTFNLGGLYVDPRMR